MQEKMEDKQEIIQLLEIGLQRKLIEKELKTIQSWENNDLTKFAIKKSFLLNKPNINYMNAIIEDYKKRNITNLETEKKIVVKMNKTNFNKMIPDWMNKKIEAKTNLETEKEIDSLIKQMLETLERN